MRRLAPLLILALTFGWAPAWAKGGVVIKGAWARASSGDHQRAPVYLSIVNRSRETARLTAAKTHRASMAMFLRPEGKGGRLEQVRVVEIPPGEVVTLAPEGLHLVLMGLQRPLRADHDLPLELFFEHQGPIEITVPILMPDASGPPRRRR